MQHKVHVLTQEKKEKTQICVLPGDNYLPTQPSLNLKDKKKRYQPKAKESKLNARNKVTYRN
jgi:hypothetical protein